jgi:hypothetical protein
MSPPEAAAGAKAGAEKIGFISGLSAGKSPTPRTPRPKGPVRTERPRSRAAAYQALLAS